MECTQLTRYSVLASTPSNLGPYIIHTHTCTQDPCLLVWEFQTKVNNKTIFVQFPWTTSSCQTNPQECYKQEWMPGYKYKILNRAPYTGISLGKFRERVFSGLLISIFYKYIFQKVLNRSYKT